MHKNFQDKYAYNIQKYTDTFHHDIEEMLRLRNEESEDILNLIDL